MYMNKTVIHGFDYLRFLEDTLRLPKGEHVPKSQRYSYHNNIRLREATDIVQTTPNSAAPLVSWGSDSIDVTYTIVATRRFIFSYIL